MTGGNSGIGGATVAALLAQGAKVASLDISAPPEGTINDNRLEVRCNVASEESVDKAVKEVVDKFEHIDILVNCAGVMDGYGLGTPLPPPILLTFPRNTRQLPQCPVGKSPGHQPQRPLLHHPRHHSYHAQERPPTTSQRPTSVHTSWRTRPSPSAQQRGNHQHLLRRLHRRRLRRHALYRQQTRPSRPHSVHSMDAS